MEMLKSKKYLINGGLDLLYIGTGFALKNITTSKEKTKHQLTGYGNSLILQGGFLLVFDAVMYFIQDTRINNFIETNNIDLTIGINNISLTLQL